MKITYSVTFRPFNNEDEKEDSGYYEGLSKHKRAWISVNRKDDALEQALTVYHEITHALIDLFLSYKFDKEYKTIQKQDPELKTTWEAVATEGGLEEKICRAVEGQVKRIFRKMIPTPFFKQMFNQGKRFQAKKRHKQRRKRS